MKYKSTRGYQAGENFHQAVLQGLAPDGGLYVPESLPSFSFKDYLGKSYRDLAIEILTPFMGTEDLARDAVTKGYKDYFSKENLVEIHETKDAYYLELYHGRTAAFKDFALALLPQFMRQSVQGRVLILTATSGDTGKAAMEGFKNVEGVDIIVFYPHQGVSEIQYLQMATQEGDNTHPVGIKGNFDDAQRGVKALFMDQDLKEDLKNREVHLSSANSINIGRLLPQVIYYAYAYLSLVDQGKLTYGDPLDLVVPTGNFGDILAGYLAKKMGLPLGNFICASNQNAVLRDFFQTGTYDTHRPFYKTSSPSMDILISSNVERFLYYLTEDTERVKNLQEDLANKGEFVIGEDIKDKLKDWYGYAGSEEEAFASIRKVLEEDHYLLDPHTAVAKVCLDKYYKDHGKKSKALVLSTASPYKFPSSVLKALGEEGTFSDQAAIEKLEDLSKTPCPQVLKSLWDKDLKERPPIQVEDMKAFVEKIGEDL